MPGQILKAGTRINVKDCSEDDLLRNYGGIFERNGEGKIVTKFDDVVKVENGKPFFLDMKGNWEPIEIENDTKKEIEEEEEEEYDEDEEEEIEDSPISQSNLYKNNPFGNAGQGLNNRQTFYYFPTSKTQNNPNVAGNTFKYKGNNEALQNNPNVAGNTFKYKGNNEALHDNNYSSNGKNPMGQRMLGEDFDDFREAINASGVIDINEKGFIKGTRDFKKDCLKNIDNCELRFYNSQEQMESEWAYLPDWKYIKEGDLRAIKLNNSSDRARMMDNINEVLDYIDEDSVKNVSSNVLRKFKQSFQKSVPECVRYVGYAALCDILKDCAQMKYSDINTEKANNTYKQVKAIIKALSLENTKEENVKHGKKKKKAFLNALRLWKDRYDELSRAKYEGTFEEIVNQQASLDLDVNNKFKNKGKLFIRI